MALVGLCLKPNGPHRRSKGRDLGCDFGNMIGLKPSFSYKYPSHLWTWGGFLKSLKRRKSWDRRLPLPSKRCRFLSQRLHFLLISSPPSSCPELEFQTLFSSKIIKAHIAYVKLRPTARIVTIFPTTTQR